MDRKLTIYIMGNVASGKSTVMETLRKLLTEKNDVTVFDEDMHRDSTKELDISNLNGINIDIITSNTYQSITGHCGQTVPENVVCPCVGDEDLAKTCTACDDKKIENPIKITEHNRTLDNLIIYGIIDTSNQ